MSATTTASARPDAWPETLDVSRTAPIPMSRLVKVELRKMADTRSGKWLLIMVAAVSVFVMAAVFVWGDPDDRTFLNLFAIAGIPLSFMLPVLGILLICSEWGQRTALVTFTLTPHRGRVLTAKVSAAILFAVAGLVVAAIPAALLTLVGGAADPWTGVSVAMMAKILLGLGLGVLWGLAFGAALLSSSLAIVAYFVVPTLIGLVGGIWVGAADKLAWIDLNQSSAALFDTVPMSGADWAHLGAGVLLWIVLVGGVGVRRVLRSEVK